MHVGGMLRFDQIPDGIMTLDRLRHHIGGRLQTARIFRQRLHMPLAWLDRPVWIEDPHFNLDNHLTHVEVSGSISDAALNELCSRYFALPLSRDRPLWEIQLVTSNFPEAGFVLLLKVHHAALDGVSAEAVIVGLLDFSTQPRELPSDNWSPEPLPTPAQDLGRCLNELRQERLEAPDVLHTALDLGRRVLKRALNWQDWHRPHFFNAPRTPFNGEISSQRQFVGVQLSLSTIKAIKNNQAGLTVNDVALALCSGALRRYLAEDGTLPKHPLIAMTPVSRRTTGGGSGNQVSSMLVDLATDEKQPLQRLRLIHQSAVEAKEYSRDIPIEKLLDKLPVIGPAAVLSAYSHWQLGRHLPPVFNVVITNVPGSPIPLFLDGAPLRNLCGMAGIYDGVGLCFVVMSYLDRLSIGITSTPTMLKDPERLRRHLEIALEELALAVEPYESDNKVPTLSDRVAYSGC